MQKKLNPQQKRRTMKDQSYPASFLKLFLGNTVLWYKLVILAFLVINPFLFIYGSPFVAGWVLIGEFIFTLAMALKCYPLPAGGLLAIEAVVIGMASPRTIYEEALINFPVILLLIFMVAGIHFMKDFLQFTFTRLLVRVQSKKKISLLFCIAGAFLSAFLDALTVTAVIIAVAYSFYEVYHKYASSAASRPAKNLIDDEAFNDAVRADLLQFRGFLRNLMMHGAVGTALGGVCTMVGEPQNLLIAETMGWHFIPFLKEVSPVSMPVLVVGLLTCLGVEHFKIFTYGFTMPGNIRSHLLETEVKMEAERGTAGKLKLILQALVGVFLIVALALHLAEVGIIGLAVIILLTAFTGVTQESQIGHAFEEALPFTALLVVFFSIVAVIHEQHLFVPIIDYVLSLKGQMQLLAYYIANGVLSAISDNVFVATVYVSQTKMHIAENLGMLPDILTIGQHLGAITSNQIASLSDINSQALIAQLSDPSLNRTEFVNSLAPEMAQKAREIIGIMHNIGAELMSELTDPEMERSTVFATLTPDAAKIAEEIMFHFDKLAVAINTGTNIPSVATPNGQAAFLFLLTSALAPVIRLSYGRMVLLAMPYTITMSLTGAFAVYFFL